MIVIIEGVDGTGKTTLANKIIDYFEPEKGGSGFSYRHTGAPQGSVVSEYASPYLDVRPGKDHFVLDRLYWSNIVYAPKYRNRVETDATKRKFFDLFWIARGAITVYCSQSSDVILKRLLERGEDYISLKDIPELLTIYDEVARKSFLDVFVAKLDEQTNYSRIIETILDGASLAEKKTANWQTALPYFLGNPIPDLVICVGEDDSLLLTGDEDKEEEERCLHDLLTYVPDMAWHISSIVNPYKMPSTAFDKLKKAKTLAIGKDVSDLLVRKRIKHGGIARSETVDDKFLPGWGNRVIDLAVSQRIQIQGI